MYKITIEKIEKVNVTKKELREHHIDHYQIALKAFRWHRVLPINACEVKGRPLKPQAHEYHLTAPAS